MRKTIFVFFSLLVVLSMALTTTGAVRAVEPAPVQAAASQQIARVEKFDAHYVAPKDAGIELLLEEDGIQLDSMAPEARAMAIQAYAQDFHDKNPDTPFPDKLGKLLDHERKPDHHQPPVVTDRSIKSMVVPVEFPNSDTFEWCDLGSVTQTGPLHNQVTPPGPKDNNTVWFEDATPALYEELYFGEGPKAGVIIDHPNLGKVDLRGKTMVNYYLEMSNKKFAPSGAVYPKWLQAAHSEGWYGADNCSGLNHNVLAPDLVREVVDAVNADDPSWNWQSFDGNGDGIVDNFTVIHAGVGQESGGGAQGDFSIWSHASSINAPSGYLACTKGAAGCSERNIYVREYSMDPENIDLGVISEEFGHAAFGLPDLYTTDAQGSISNWTIMESGSWNGILGGMEPAPFTLWFKYILGWANPRELDYDSPATETRIGQLELTPRNMNDGLKINLPDKTVETPNPLGSGQAWWSDRGDGANFYLDRTFDLTSATTPVFSFNSYWSFEEECDYGYVQASADGGATWDFLTDTNPDTNGSFVDDGTGVEGLNGEGQGVLSFDLAPYIGKSVTVRLWYTSDTGVQMAGWWADDFKLADGDATLFTDDVEGSTEGWTTNKWTITPLSRIYPQFYLVEWRNGQGFDHGLQYPYQTVYNDEDEWQVDRTPYSVPGMLVYFRDATYESDYQLTDSIYDPPSIGPKHMLLLVDSHYWPLTWDNFQSTSGANLRITVRAQPSNAAFSLKPTTPFTIRLGYDPATSEYVDTPLETKTFAPQAPVSTFHDSLGYYPGLWYRPDNRKIYFWQADASMVVPATANYTTRITDGKQAPLTDLYGATVSGFELGSGNPGDAGAQYGLHIALTQQARDGTWGKIVTWNSKQLETARIMTRPTVKPGAVLTFTYQVHNDTPIDQKVTLTAPIPENTTYMHGMKYNKDLNAAVWTGTLHANRSEYITLMVKVNKNAAPGTVITGTLNVADDALGSQAAPVEVTVDTHH